MDRNNNSFAANVIPLSQKRYPGTSMLYDNFNQPLNVFETSVVRQMYETIDLCLKSGLTGLITGAPGIGKSTALRYIAAKEADFARYIMISTAQSQTRQVLKLIGNAFNWNVDAQYMHELWEIAEWRLPDEAFRSRFLLIDEAQNLDNDALREVVGFHERFGFQVFLVGNESTLKRRGAGAAFDQIRDRIGIVLSLKGLEDDDFRLMAASHQVEGQEAEELAIRYGQKTTMRQLNNVLSLARNLAGVKDPIKAEHIKNAILLKETVPAEQFLKRK